MKENTFDQILVANPPQASDSQPQGGLPDPPQGRARLSILMVEDSEDDAMLIERELDRGGYDATIQRVQTARQMAAALDRSYWDVVIADYVLPRFSAPAALELLQRKGIDIPFIIVSGAVGEDTAAMALKAGAHDFLRKDYLARLVPAIERERRDAANRRQRRKAEEALAESESRYRALFENATDGIILRDRTGCIIMASPAMAEIIGFGVAELAGMNVRRFLTESSFETVMSRQRRLLESHKTATERYEVVIVRKDGTRRIGETAIRKVQWSGEEALLVLLRDITDRKRAEEEIKTLSGRLLDAQERERRYIGTELHDEIGASLTALKICLDQARLSVNEDETGELEHAAELLDRTMKYVRSLSHSLRASILEDFGLQKALWWYVTQFSEQTRVKVTLTYECGLAIFSTQMETAIYRIVQESLTNIAKYAGATEVSVKCTYSEETVGLTIEDNGQGFEAASIGLESSGLSGMSDRALLLGGTLTVDSSPGWGTRIRCVLPVLTWPYPDQQVGGGNT